MDKICQTEIDFVKKSLSTGVRPDGRDFLAVREQTVENTNIIASDDSIRIKRGRSEIEISITFRSTLQTLKKLGLYQDNEVVISSACLFKNGSFGIYVGNQSLGEFVTLQCSFNEPNPCFEKLENWLIHYNLGCQIELHVISNDGNVFDMFFEGIRILFQSRSVPNILDLLKDIETGIMLPVSKSYGIIGNSYIVDPCWIEEKSIDGVLHIFYDMNKITGSFEGSCDFETVEQIISFVSSKE